MNRVMVAVGIGENNMVEITTMTEGQVLSHVVLDREAALRHADIIIRHAKLLTAMPTGTLQ